MNIVIKSSCLLYIKFSWSEYIVGCVYSWMIIKLALGGNNISGE